MDTSLAPSDLLLPWNWSGKFCAMTLLNAKAPRFKTHLYSQQLAFMQPVEKPTTIYHLFLCPFLLVSPRSAQDFDLCSTGPSAARARPSRRPSRHHGRTVVKVEGSGRRIPQSIDVGFTRGGHQVPKKHGVFNVFSFNSPVVRIFRENLLD